MTCKVCKHTNILQGSLRDDTAITEENRDAIIDTLRSLVFLYPISGIE